MYGERGGVGDRAKEVVDGQWEVKCEAENEGGVCGERVLKECVDSEGDRGV